jgi:hypothetical protein
MELVLQIQIRQQQLKPHVNSPLPFIYLTAISASAVIDYVFLGLKVLWWIVIAICVLCCGVCTCWLYCAAFWFRAVFIREGTEVMLLKRKMEAAGTDEGGMQITETLIVAEEKEEIITTPGVTLENNSSNP